MVRDGLTWAGLRPISLVFWSSPLDLVSTAWMRITETSHICRLQTISCRFGAGGLGFLQTSGGAEGDAGHVDNCVDAFMELL